MTHSIKFLEKELIRFVAITSCISGLSVLALPISASVTNDPQYNSMRSQFLNINPQYFREIDIKNMSSSEITNFLGGRETKSPILLEEINDNVHANWSVLGANHACNNANGELSACWFNTGGSQGQKGTEVCGMVTNNDYISASANTSLHCQIETAWSGFRFWIGPGHETKFLNHHFPNATEIPVNRLCTEIEFPSSAKLIINHSDKNSNIVVNPHLSQLVNPDVAGSNIKNIQWEWGTYTATKTDPNGFTSNEELGGTYQNGGSHFYHKPTSYGRTPADRIYAINNNTLVACMGDVPTGVRSGMRPSYAANPLLTLGSVDSKGITTAPSYLNYVTRVYLQANMDPSSVANYPFDIKITKLWLMYEENEIFATNYNNFGTLGLEMIESGQTAFHPFIIHNNAEQDRTYRVFMAMGSNLLLNKETPAFKLYEDKNNNGILEENESLASIRPDSLITLKAKENKSFILAHTPDFQSNYQSFQRHGKNVSQGSISFIEEGRMRSASYAVRTWQGSIEDQKSKNEWFKSTQYPSTNSEWAIYHDYNLGKNLSSNPDLLRNTPDFIKILGGAVAQPASPAPASPPPNFEAIKQ